MGNYYRFAECEFTQKVPAREGMRSAGFNPASLRTPNATGRYPSGHCRPGMPSVECIQRREHAFDFSGCCGVAPSVRRENGLSRSLQGRKASQGGAGGARLPSILFIQRAWFSEDGRAGEHRLPHLGAHPKFHDIRSSARGFNNTANLRHLLFAQRYHGI